MLPQPRFREVNVSLDAAQHFIGNGVLVAELQNSLTLDLQRLVGKTLKFR